MSGLETALLATLIPIGYLTMATLTFFVSYVAFKSTDTFDPGGSAGMLSVFWPITLPLFLAWRRAQSVTGSELSRKQRREIEFKRQSAQVAKDAAKAQREWQQLLAEEQS